MSFWFGLLIGYCVGVPSGFLFAALMAFSSDAQREVELHNDLATEPGPSKREKRKVS
jgi:hypothetical protein